MGAGWVQEQLLRRIQERKRQKAITKTEATMASKTPASKNNEPFLQRFLQHSTFLR